MSGRFPKCSTLGCRRLLIRKTGSQQLTCGGCQQTFEVADLINAQQNASLERTTSDVSLEQQSNTSQSSVLSSNDDDLRRSPFSTSTYPIVNQNHPNVLESFSGHNRNSSASSFGSEEYAIEREKSTKLAETIVPPTRRPSSYHVSASSRSISSDEGGSTILRNTHAESRRTRRRGVSTAESLGEIQIIEGNLIYASNYEEEKFKPGSSETNYPIYEYKMDQQAGKAQGRIISEEEIEEREQFNGKFSYQRGRDLDSSFEETASYRNRDIPFGYKSKTEQEVEGPKPVYEPNYPWNQPKMNSSSKRGSIDDNSSIHGSLVSEEDSEERAYPSRKNSYASFDGSTSSRSFSSDEGGSRIGAGETRFSSRRTYRSRALSSENPNVVTCSAAQFNGVEKRSVPSQQNELNDIVNKLARIGITREKLLILLLKQTGSSIKDNPMHQNRGTRSLVRQLSVQIPLPLSPDSGSSRGRRRPATHHCRSMFGGTPFVVCHSCETLLQLPIGMPTKRFVKIRCGKCSETQVCPLPAKGMTYNPLHKALGYESARFLLAPSRQFSINDGLTN